MADNEQKEHPSNLWDFLREYESTAWAVGLTTGVTLIVCTLVVCITWYNVTAITHPQPEKTVTITTEVRR